MSQTALIDAPDPLVEFFLNSASSVVRLECLEISHPDFTRVYYVVRNATRGITVRHEDGIWRDYEYHPMRIQSLGITADLDSGIRVDLGDLGTLVPSEIKSVMAAGGMAEKPLVNYRVYRADVLDKVMDGPLRLEIKKVSRNDKGWCSFEAKAVALNASVTGEIYDLTRFYPLRGFLY